jgi:serine/threonine protein kinase
MARCSICGAEKLTQDADCPACATDRHALVQSHPGASLQDETQRDPEASKAHRKDPLLGETVGNYRIESLLGTGGMGAVYRAFHPGLGRSSAVKVLRAEFSEDPSIVERFFREAKATNQIKHPGIVDIFDLGSMANGRCYMVMELLEGESLEQYATTHGAMAESSVTTVGRKVLDILAAAHQKQIIHRDLKPANIFLAKGPNGITTVKLLDSGIAKILASRAGLAPTADGAILGTPRYMPPEQARSPSSIDPRADFYSLGVVLYELATGHPIFPAKTPIEMMQRHQLEQPAPPRKVRPSLSKEFEVAILCALSKDPSQRFKDCESFARALYTSDTAEDFDEEGDDISTFLDVKAVPQSEPSLASKEGHTLDLIQSAPDAQQNSQDAIAVSALHPALVATLPGGPSSGLFQTEPDSTPAPDKFSSATPLHPLSEPTAPGAITKLRKPKHLLWPVVLLLSFFSVIVGYLALQYLGSLIDSSNRQPSTALPGKVVPASTQPITPKS